jgi:hypothetical protein
MVKVLLETGSGRQISVGPFQSDWSISGIEADFKESLPVMDQGSYFEGVSGDDVIPEWSVSMLHSGKLHSSTLDTVLDMVMHKGTALYDATTDPGLPWHLKATIQVTWPKGGTDTFTCPNCRVKTDYQTAKEGNVLPLAGRCYRDVTGADPVQIT